MRLFAGPGVVGGVQHGGAVLARDGRRRQGGGVRQGGVQQLSEQRQGQYTEVAQCTCTRVVLCFHKV